MCTAAAPYTIRGDTDRQGRTFQGRTEAGMWGVIGDSPWVPTGSRTVSGSGDPGAAVAADIPLSSARLGVPRRLPRDLGGSLHSQVCLQQPAWLSHTLHTGAASPCPAAQCEQSSEGWRGTLASLCALGLTWERGAAGAPGRQGGRPWGSRHSK